MERFLTTEQMRYCEKRSDELGVSLARLMKNAGKALSKCIKGCDRDMLRDVCILVGKGNNGGDGLVAANILYGAGIDVTVVLCCGWPDTDLSGDAFRHLDKSIKILNGVDGIDKIKSCSILCDCIFGTGFHGNIRDEIIPIFKACNESKAFRIACDIPSGATARNGVCDENTFKANTTITFHKMKTGMLLSPCKYFCGEIVVADIGIPEGCERGLSTSLCKLDEEYIKSILPERIPYGHKGTFGKIVAVCGSRSYIGAAEFSSVAAMRSGAGLVELCTNEFVISSLGANMPECTFSAMKCDDEGFMTSENAQTILKKCERANCLLIGCGLGNTEQTRALVKALIEGCPENCRIVIDADGLNSLSTNIDVLYKKKTEVILTPHPAELARLCGTDISDVLENRLERAYELTKKYGVTILSKGAESFVVTKNKIALIVAGNTALAKGGSGDMLAGLTASFVAQGMDIAKSGYLGSWVLGKTAEMLAQTKSQRGIIASDILAAFPVYLNQLEG